ncbi:MAG: DUF819 family protein, partial [Chloroflexota bacterium]
PGDSVAYEFLMGSGVSAGIVLILLGVDISSIKQAGPDMLKAFGLGAIGSALGSAIMALLLFPSIGEETWKLSGQFTGTYVGGGMNFAALGAALGTSSDLYSAAVAADVSLTAFWLIVCLAVPVLLGRQGGEGQGQVADQTFTLEQALYRSERPINIMHIAVLLSITFGSLWFSALLASWISFFPQILWLTTIVLLLAQLPAVKKLSGSAMMGNFLLLLFLASNGANSVIAKILEVGPSVFYYALGTIAVHGAVIFGVGSLLKIDAGTLAIASQANVGGSSSAMALASARGYGDRILSGVAVGLLGYAVGNYLGLGVANLIQTILA